MTTTTVNAEPSDYWDNYIIFVDANGWHHFTDEEYKAYLKKNNIRMQARTVTDWSAAPSRIDIICPQ